MYKNCRTYMLILSLIFTSAASWAGVGKVIIAKGETYAIDASDNYRVLKRRSAINEGDTLFTGNNSEMHIRFEDNAVLALRANTQMKITHYSGGIEQKDKVFMELLNGGFRTITGSFGKSDKNAYQIQTPSASIGVRGTNYEALLSEGELLIGVYQGGIWLQNNTGEVFLGQDSSYSFARVSDADSLVKGLLEAPQELSKPLSASLTSAPNEAEKPSDNDSAALREEDNGLSIETLFVDSENAAADNASESSTEALETLMVTQVTTEVEDAIDTLTSSSDLRLTSAQAEFLASGNASVGFVVANEVPTGYGTAQYQLNNFTAYSGINSVNTVSFNVTLGDQTYAVQVNDSYSDATSLATEINAQISAANGELGPSGSSLSIPALVKTSVNSSGTAIVFEGYIDDSEQSIVIDNFSGTSADTLAEAMGLCSTTENTCTGSYQSGNASTGDYNSAIHYIYSVPGEEGPVFVNYENDDITLLGTTYVTPDNVLKGPSSATLAQFGSVNTLTDSNENLIEWGYWASSSDNPATLYKDPQDLSIHETVTTPIFFITAPPASAADLVGELTLSDTIDWHFTTSHTDEMHHQGDNSAYLEATLAVNFGTSEATGTLTVAEQNDDWAWSLSYYGAVNGAQFQSNYGWGEFIDNTSVIPVIGHVDGLFTPAQGGSGHVGFVGGFGIHSTDNSQSSQGVFFLK